MASSALDEIVLRRARREFELHAGDEVVVEGTDHDVNRFGAVVE